MKFTIARPGWPLILKTLLVLAAGLLLIGWLVKTPPGLLGKADAIAYAVCHRIASHSFFVGDRQTPLCARCTGMYLGALLGMIYLQQRGRKGGMPPLKIMVVFGLFLAAFALDGSNSYLHLIPGAPGLYQPQNWMRLVTGTGVGMGIAAILNPVINQTLWQQFSPEPVLKGWREFLPMLLLGGLVDILVLNGNLLVMFPLAVFSAFSVIMILTMVYTVVWTMMIKQENRFLTLQGLWVPLLAGFTTALLQISVFDAGRFWLTGTWAGFNL